VAAGQSELRTRTCGSTRPSGPALSRRLGCSPIKAVRELGSERRETVRSLSVVGAGNLRGVERMLDAHNATSMLCAKVREDPDPEWYCTRECVGE